MRAAAAKGAASAPALPSSASHPRQAAAAALIAGLALAGCTATHVEVTSAAGDHLVLDSTRAFQQTLLSYDPASGALTYSSDPQAQQAAELVKAGASAVVMGAAKAAGAPVP